MAAYEPTTSGKRETNARMTIWIQNQGPSLCLANLRNRTPPPLDGICSGCGEERVVISLTLCPRRIVRQVAHFEQCAVGACAVTPEIREEHVVK